MLVSIVVRTYNEQRHLPDLLRAIAAQDTDHEVETVLVDSGSNDDTLAIAGQHGCRIVHIAKHDFTFGRSLNVGCRAARGDVLVFISGHCVPTDARWLHNLVGPLGTDGIVYTYGRQVGGDTSKFSECQVFRKHYPAASPVVQPGYFCNNANAAMRRADWERAGFDEQLPGLEDLALAKQLWLAGGKVGYVADAGVYHHHDESWRVVKRRYEREAIALQSIMPEVQISFADFLRYWASAVFLDLGAALAERTLLRNAWQIVAYRFMQFWGSYQGNNEHRKLSQAMKDKYFYPK
jgi:glycosyltransferase involved in cell wall biosynthesis